MTRMIYREIFKRGSMKLSAQRLPLLRHQAATAAVAWSFGLTPTQYRPRIET